MTSVCERDMCRPIAGPSTLLAKMHSRMLKIIRAEAEVAEVAEVAGEVAEGGGRNQSAHVADKEVSESSGSAGVVNASTLGSLSVTTAKWLADTGATSHMIPHRDWFRKYEQHRVPIRLANGDIVWSAGVTAGRDSVLLLYRIGKRED